MRQKKGIDSYLPVFLPGGKKQEWWNVVGCFWGRTAQDAIEVIQQQRIRGTVIPFLGREYSSGVEFIILGGIFKSLYSVLQVDSLPTELLKEAQEYTSGQSVFSLADLSNPGIPTRVYRHWGRILSSELLGQVEIRLVIGFSLVAESCPILCDPVNCSTPGLPVHHQLYSDSRPSSR